MEPPMDPEPAATVPTGGERLPDALHLPFARLLGDLADFEGQVSDLPKVQAVSIEAISLDLPVELIVEVGDDGRLRVLASPPTQRTETTILPVFHRLALRVVSDGANDG